MEPIFKNNTKLTLDLYKEELREPEFADLLPQRKPEEFVPHVQAHGRPGR